MDNNKINEEEIIKECEKNNLIPEGWVPPEMPIGKYNYKIGDRIINQWGWLLEIVDYAGWDPYWKSPMYQTRVIDFPDGCEPSVTCKIGDENVYVRECLIKK